MVEKQYELTSNDKDIKEAVKHECHTKYGDLKKHAVFGNREAIKEMRAY